MQGAASEPGRRAGVGRGSVGVVGGGRFGAPEDGTETVVSADSFAGDDAGSDSGGASGGEAAAQNEGGGTVLASDGGPLAVGERVKHAQFGSGTILHIDDSIVDIRFDIFGHKKLDLDLAVVEDGRPEPMWHSTWMGILEMPWGIAEVMVVIVSALYWVGC